GRALSARTQAPSSGPKKPKYAGSLVPEANPSSEMNKSEVSALIAISHFLRTTSESISPFAPSERSKHLVERRVALVHPGLHARLDHAVALLGRVEQRHRDKFRATVAELVKGHRVD